MSISTGSIDGRVDAIYAFRQRKRLLPGIAAVVLAFGLVGGLFFVVSWVVDQQSSSKAALQIPNIEDPVGNDNPADNRVEFVSDHAVAEPVADTKPNSPIPRVFAEPEFFSRHDWDQVWHRINGYLVRLEITTPVGSHEATGMIVDSRGWVVTSLSAIQNATTVTVTGAAKRLQDEPHWLELSDLARGIIAKDPEYDIALIAINRSQVINLADPKLASVDDVVSAQRFLVARTPPPGQAAWIAEGRVGLRARFADLDESGQRVIQKNDLATGDQFRWIICNMANELSVTKQFAGSPIVDLDGRVLAFSSGYSLDGNLLAVPSTVVFEMLESMENSPQLQPFPGNRVAGRSGDPDVDAANPESSEPIDEFEQATKAVEIGIQGCRNTDWTADNADEYVAFQNLSAGIFKMQELIESAIDSDEQLQRIESVDAILDQISESLSPDLEMNEFENGKSNQWFANAISPENPWFVLAVTVAKNSISTAPVDGYDAATIRLHGTDEVVIAKTGNAGRLFQPGRKLLIFGKVDMERSAPYKNDVSTEKVRVIDVHAGFRINLRGSR